MTWLWELIGNVLVQSLGWYVQKYARDEELKREYVSFVEIMNKKGLATVQMRINSRDQIERVNDLWAKEKEATNKDQ